jgi:heme/copper-type cytochrome/quinol oxidase subunit 2
VDKKKNVSGYTIAAITIALIVFGGGFWFMYRFFKRNGKEPEGHELETLNTRV